MQNIYQKNGYKNRDEYLDCIKNEECGIDLDVPNVIFDIDKVTPSIPISATEKSNILYFGYGILR